MIKHTLQHTWQRRQHFDLQQLAFGAMRPLHNFGGTIRLGSLRQMRESWREPWPTYNAMTDGLQAGYRPLYPLPARFAANFEPLYVTDTEGQLTEEVIAGQQIAEQNVQQLQPKKVPEARTLPAPALV